ncbi:hypothetical protein [Burkholderia glumae]
MSEEAKSTTTAAFEAAMRRCADDAGLEPRLERGADGHYVQPETRSALSAWIGAHELVAEQLRCFAEFGASHLGRAPGYQTGFLEYLAHAADRLDMASRRPATSPRAGVAEVSRAIDEASFDDAVIDAFARIMKASMAASRAAGRSGWWSAPASELSASLREHVEKGDPVDVALLAAMHWYKGEQIEQEASDGINVIGKMMKLATDSSTSSEVTVECGARTVTVRGLPNAQAKHCKPLLYEQVRIVICAVPTAPTAPEPRVTEPPISGDDLNWITAGHAAHQTGVDLDVVRGWATRGEVKSRDDRGTLMVECASLLARTHRHTQQARDAGSAPSRQEHLVASGRTARAGFLHAAGRLFAGHKA